MGTKEGTDMGKESRHFHDKVFGFVIFTSLLKASPIPGDREVAQPSCGPAHVLGK